MPCDEGISGRNASIELLIGRANFQHVADTQTRMLQPGLDGPFDQGQRALWAIWVDLRPV